MTCYYEGRILTGEGGGASQRRHQISWGWRRRKGLPDWREENNPDLPCLLESFALIIPSVGSVSPLIIFTN